MIKKISSADFSDLCDDILKGAKTINTTNTRRFAKGIVNVAEDDVSMIDKMINCATKIVRYNEDAAIFFGKALYGYVKVDTPSTKQACAIAFHISTLSHKNAQHFLDVLPISDDTATRLARSYVESRKTSPLLERTLSDILVTPFIIEGETKARINRKLMEAAVCPSRTLGSRKGIERISPKAYARKNFTP
ncbi:MAG: hypothetical protein FWF24_07135 [Alphaproteobacteria bacterium]|nr:hypothetical protein [Alphaproteobacteria bacterium]